MGLTLLAPLALLLGALLALPIIAHLSRQIPRDRVAFGAMLLVERMVKRLRRRRRIKDWPLLLLRIGVVALFVLGATAPQFRYPGTLPEFGGSGRVVLVVDRSLSMSLQDGGSTLLQRAREDAVRVLGDVSPGALVGLVAFGDDAERLTASMTSDHDRVRAQLAGIQPGYGRSDLRAALLEARRLLGGEPGEVLVFTDEAGPRTVTDARTELQYLIEGGSAVIPRVHSAKPPRNVAVVSARYGDGVEGGQVTVRIANFGPDPVEVACEVVLPGDHAVPIFVDLPPEGEAEETVTVPPEIPGGVGRAWCDDPDLAADDDRYFHLPRVGASRVLVVDGDPGDTPTRSEVYFLERALAPWGGVRSGVTLDVTTPFGLSDLDPERHRVVFLANVADPGPYALMLTEFVRKGGNLVITGGENVTADRYNSALGSILPATLRRSRGVADAGEQGLPLAMPAQDSELWEPFSRSGRGSFVRIRAHKLLTLLPYKDVPGEVETRLSYEGGLPGLVDRRIGSGRVVLWTGTMDLAWGNLPLQAVFMPMMQRLVGWLGGESGDHAKRLEARVGETVSLQLPDLAMHPDVIGPDGGREKSRLEGSRVVFRPDEPGAYQVALQDAPPLAWIAVNTDPEESDVRPDQSIVGVEREIAPELLERRIDLSRGVLAFAVLLMLAQAMLAARGGS